MTDPLSPTPRPDDQPTPLDPEDRQPDPWIAWSRKRFALADLLALHVADTRWMVPVDDKPEVIRNA